MNNKNNSSNKEIKKALNGLKTEVASELGIDLKATNLTAKDAGRVGGQMVKKLIEDYESKM